MPRGARSRLRLPVRTLRAVPGRDRPLHRRRPVGEERRAPEGVRAAARDPPGLRLQPDRRVPLRRGGDLRHLPGRSGDHHHLQLQAIVLYTTKNQFITQHQQHLPHRRGTPGSSRATGASCSSTRTPSAWARGTPRSAPGSPSTASAPPPAIDGAQPMDMNLVRFHQNALRKVWGELYVGPGISFDRYYGIDDLRLNLSGEPAGRHQPLRLQPGRRFRNQGVQLQRAQPQRALRQPRLDHQRLPRRLRQRSRTSGTRPGSAAARTASFVSSEFRTYLGLSHDGPAQRARLLGRRPGAGERDSCRTWPCRPSAGTRATGPGAAASRGASAGRRRSTPRRSGGSASPTTGCSAAWSSPTCPRSPGPR